MTPPINIDGTQIIGASIDGTDVQEITVDGTQVFSKIPDSAIQQLKMTEGSGSPTADAINGFDAALVNDAAFVDDVDAIGDHTIEFPSPPDAVDVEIRLNEDFVAGALTIAPDSFDSASINQIVDGEIDENNNFSHMVRNNTSGNTRFLVRVGGGFVGVTFATSIATDGSKQRIGYRYDGSNLAVFYNGSKDNTTAQSGALDNWGWNALGFRKYRGNGTVVQDRGFDGDVDNFINFATSTASELPDDQFFADDFQRQPWS